jgi:hypothetical protein
LTATAQGNTKISTVAIFGLKLLQLQSQKEAHGCTSQTKLEQACWLTATGQKFSQDVNNWNFRAEIPAVGIIVEYKGCTSPCPTAYAKKELFFLSFRSLEPKFLFDESNHGHFSDVTGKGK